MGKDDQIFFSNIFIFIQPIVIAIFFDTRHLDFIYLPKPGTRVALIYF